MHISLAAEPLFHVGNFSVTNSLLVSLITSVLIIIFSLFFRLGITKYPGKFQSFIELAIEFFEDVAVSIGGQKAVRFLPLVFSFFIFILVSNWIGLLPGFGSIGFYEHVDGHEVFVPILRGATADLNTTLALATFSVVSIQIFGFAANKFSYFSKFINFKGPVDFFTGILELISEFSKVISFSFRLFGNIFAGEVLLSVITHLVPIIVPIPFFGLEIFVGLIQAVVFSMLTLVFINMATISHHEASS